MGRLGVATVAALGLMFMTGCATKQCAHCASSGYKATFVEELKSATEFRLLGLVLPTSVANQYVYADLTKVVAGGINIEPGDLKVPAPYLAARFGATLDAAGTREKFEFVLGKNPDQLGMDATVNWVAAQGALRIDTGWLGLVRRWPQTLGGVSVGPAHGIISPSNDDAEILVSKSGADYWFLRVSNQPTPIITRNGSAATVLKTINHYVKAESGTIAPEAQNQAGGSGDHDKLRDWISKIMEVAKP